MPDYYYIGLMSGTSLDAVDAALIHIPANGLLQLMTIHSEPIEEKLKSRLLGLTQPGHNELDEMGELDMEFGEKLAEAVLNLLKKTDIKKQHIRAIGSHGQTIRHRPQARYPFTLQIGSPNVIALKTGIQTIANFRPNDMVLGGQGAPLTPAFHNALWRTPHEDRWIVNIGGIANLTFLSKNPKNAVFGFDSGPGNCLMDLWAQKHLKKPYDAHGEWATKGRMNKHLLEKCLKDPYFHQSPPKSTGREYFSRLWIDQVLDQLKEKIEAVDIQATLLELTAITIAQAAASHPGPLYVCGGGARNTQLMKRLEALSQKPLFTTEKLGLNPDWVEAAAFAWLAHQALENRPGNLPTVTGARCDTLLGAIY